MAQMMLTILLPQSGYAYTVKIKQFNNKLNYHTFITDV
jgi:hypothetical protein